MKCILWQQLVGLVGLLRATSGASDPNLNIGYKRMYGSYIALHRFFAEIVVREIFVPWDSKTQ